MISLSACRKASIASHSRPISELSEDILSRAPRDALRSWPRRCCGRADCQFGWWRGTRNLLRQNSFWLRRPDLNQRDLDSEPKGARYGDTKFGWEVFQTVAL